MIRIGGLCLIAVCLGAGGCKSSGSSGSTVVIFPPHSSHPKTKSPAKTPPPPSVAKPGPPAHAKAHGKRRKDKFIYYPNHQVYRSSKSGRYYWFESGSWQVGVRLPGRIVIGSKAVAVELELDADKPYRTHDHVRKSHPGKAKGHGKTPPGKAKNKGKGPKSIPPGQSKGKGKGKGKGKDKDK